MMLPNSSLLNLLWATHPFTWGKVRGSKGNKWIYKVINTAEGPAGSKQEPHLPKHTGLQACNSTAVWEYKQLVYCQTCPLLQRTSASQCMYCTCTWTCVVTKRSAARAAPPMCTQSGLQWVLEPFPGLTMGRREQDLGRPSGPLQDRKNQAWRWNLLPRISQQVVNGLLLLWPPGLFK